MKKKEHTEEENRSFYRVPTEFQIRIKRLSPAELEVFQSFALRPSAYAGLRTEIETQIQSLEIREESKNLFQRAFSLLLSIDQRLERLEESVQNAALKEGSTIEAYEW